MNTNMEWGEKISLLLLVILFVAPIVSAAPFVSSVRVNPSNPAAGDTVRCDIDYPIQNEVYDTQYTQYAFYRNNVLVQPWDVSDRFLCTNCIRGTKVSCQARLVNGSNYLNSPISTDVVFVNAPPVLTVNISPDYPAENQSIFCYVGSASDPDGDVVTVSGYRWSNRSTTSSVWRSSLSGPIVGSNIVRAGQEWRCDITASDGSAIVNSYAGVQVHNARLLPGNYSGAQPRQAKISWFVNYGDYKEVPVQYGGYQGDELGYQLLSRNNQYMYVFSAFCLRGDCTSAEIGIQNQTTYINQNPAANPADPLGSFMFNPQNSAKRYPQLTAGTPSLRGWNYSQSPDCFGNQRPGVNGTCTVPFVVEQRTPSVATVQTIVSTCPDGSGGATGFGGDVICGKQNVTLNLVSLITPECDMYDQFSVLPHDWNTTQNDTIYAMGFAHIASTGEWVDVTHLTDFISSNPNIATIDDSNDWIISVREAGDVAITANFCGMQDVALIHVFKNLCSGIDELSLSTQLIQEFEGSAGEVDVSVSGLGVDPLTITNVVEMQSDVLAWDIDTRLTYNVKECNITQLCGAHHSIALDDGSCPAGMPLRKTISTRTRMDQCDHFRSCASYTAQEWVEKELRIVFGNYSTGYYAEATRGDLPGAVSDDVQSLVPAWMSSSVMNFNYNGPNRYVSLYDLICTHNSFPPGTIPVFCADVDFEETSIRVYRDAVNSGDTMTQMIARAGISDKLLKSKRLIIEFASLPARPGDPYTIHYSACGSDNTDVVMSKRGCNYCVNNATKYMHGSAFDVSADHVPNYCQVNSPGVWNSTPPTLESCSLSSGYQSCSEAGDTYVPNSSLFYTPGSEQYGFWCVYNNSLNDFSWLTGATGGINISQIESMTTETCGDGYDGNCNMYNSFLSLGSGRYNFSTYREGGMQYPVTNYTDNVDRFDNACFGGLNVTVFNTRGNVPMKNATVTVSFRAQTIDTPYVSGFTNNDAHYVVPGGLPATKYLVTASNDSCASDSLVVDINYSTMSNIQLNLSCAPCLDPTVPCCGNGRWEPLGFDGINGTQDDEMCDTYIDGSGVFTIVGPTPLCSDIYDSSGATCSSSCEVRGCSSLGFEKSATCPGGGKLVIIRRPVLDPISNELITMAIATCSS